MNGDDTKAPDPQPRTALLVFSRSPSTETKCLGLGPSGNRRLLGSLLSQTTRAARAATRFGAAALILSTDAPDRPERPGGPIDPENPPGDSGCQPRRILDQRGAGFEARFLDALHRTAALGFRRIVVVGTDTPGLTPEDLRDAIATPPGQTCVGPSSDGGFYLLAIDAWRIEELRGLPWNRPALCTTLLRRIGASGAETSIHLRPLRLDIDDVRDVIRLRGRLDLLRRARLNWLGPPLRSDRAVGANRTPTPPRFLFGKILPNRAPPGLALQPIE